MTKMNKKKLLNAIENSGGILTTIAKRCDVSRVTLYAYLKKHPELNKYLHGEREKIIDLAETSLFTQVQEKQAWATKFLLATVGKNRGYTERTEQIVKADTSVRVSTEELARVFEECKQ